MLFHISALVATIVAENTFLLKISPFGAGVQLPTGPTVFKMNVYIFFQGTLPYFPCFSLLEICILCLQNIYILFSLFHCFSYCIYLEKHYMNVM